MFNPKLGYCPLWEDMKLKLPHIRYGDLRKLHKILDKKSNDYGQLRKIFIDFFKVNGDRNFDVFMAESKYTNQYPRPHRKIKKEMLSRRDEEKINSKRNGIGHSSKLSPQYVFLDIDAISRINEYSPTSGRKRKTADPYDEENI
jgi:hypothetical protein